MRRIFPSTAKPSGEDTPSSSFILHPSSFIARRSWLRLFLLAFVTGLSGALMPGPLLLAVIEQTTLQGFHAAILLVTGHALLELILVALLVLGLRAVLERPAVRGAIGVVGGAALVYMGQDMLRSVGNLSLALNGASAADGPAGHAYGWPTLLLAGAVVCAANPYFTGWWATVGAGQLAHMAPRTPGEYLAFYSGHESADFAWYAVVGLIIVTGRRWLTDGMYRGLILVCAVLILVLGLGFFYKGCVFILRRGKAA
jgi:threonine/homoserine/homoserine lactone efflux protein